MQGSTGYVMCIAMPTPSHLHAVQMCRIALRRADLIVCVDLAIGLVGLGGPVVEGATFTVQSCVPFTCIDPMIMGLNTDLP